MNEEIVSTEFDGDHIFEPLFAYKNLFKDKHHANATAFFDDLTQKSGVDIEANRVTAKEIKKLNTERDSLIKIIKKFVSLRGLSIFFIALSVISVGYGIYDIYENGSSTAPILFIVGGAVVLIAMIIVIAASLSPKIKALRSDKAVLDGKINAQIEKGRQQMDPLNRLFRRGMHTDLFKKATPIINLDRVFDSRRLDYLVSKFGLAEVHDVNRSTLFVQSGDMVGNPFFFARDLIHWMGTKRYEGSIVIHWTTTTYSNGKASTQYHTQTLYAHVDKPFPYYKEQPYLVYGNEAAPDLTFSRTEKDTENMNDKQIERTVNKEIKKINRKAEKSIKAGGEFTVMGNSEFEVLFGATDRSDEVQFRLLFTPLAQKQLLQLMKEKEIGFGDDFDFIKHKMINILYPKHLAGVNFDPSPVFFQGYDYDAMKAHFVNYNDAYFKDIFFAFAPLLSIPLYQQQKPHEYIYKDYYPSYVSFYEHEHIANMMNTNEFKHPLSVTRNILKTSVVKSGENRDTINVTAYGFRTEDRIDYINVLGGDGRYHSVPVKWQEYIRVSNTSSVEVNIVGEEKEESYAEKVKWAFEDLRSRNIQSPQDAYRLGAFIAFVIKK